MWALSAAVIFGDVLPSLARARTSARHGLRPGRQQTAPVYRGMMVTAVIEAFRKLDSRTPWGNPAMFGVEIVSPRHDHPVHS